MHDPLWIISRASGKLNSSFGSSDLIAMSGPQISRQMSVEHIYSMKNQIWAGLGSRASTVKNFWGQL